MKPRRKTESALDRPNRANDSHVGQKSRFSSPRAKKRSDKTVPADRGAKEQESLSQGSE
ncbi:MAG TPA: hypothetical protein VK530_02920 [Candidatus Acidoferrum sp.]|nr:hypothetical protein [Candidatus Acidoferrum sp.]